ncbi:flavin reductase family protein [Neoroseomonas rubea]|uniref:flavin reductase family protein n=1 Tax=Neoroseomonas rubea TaxID=2748666 RepID=UPI0018DEF75A|nr:flavin reductase family protein [Roseomonas rubea]
MPRRFPLSRVYQLLKPGSVVLLTTSLRGRHNVMALSWHMMIEFEPPLVGCIVSGRQLSFETLRPTRECVLAIPEAHLGRQVAAIGNCSGRATDKFAAFGLTPLPARHVAAPLVAKCFANLECRIADTRWGDRYNMFVLEVIHAWREPGVRAPRTLHHEGCGRFAVADERIRLTSRAR